MLNDQKNKIFTNIIILMNKINKNYKKIRLTISKSILIGCWLVILNLAAANSLLAASDQSSTSHKILISQTAEHPTFTATAKGIIDGLSSNGYSVGYNLTVKRTSVRANANWAAQVAKSFINQQPNLIIAMGTMAAESFVTYTESNQANLIFSTVTDPLGANLMASEQTAKSNISGVASNISPDVYLRTLKAIQPNLQYLGIVYNRLEKNSVFIVQQLEQACHKFGIKLIRQASATANHLKSNILELAFKVDAILVNNDNTALQQIKSIIRAANIADIPVYVSDIAAIKMGALAALGVDHYQLGLHTGEMAAMVLDGTAINDIPVKFINEHQLYINMPLLKKFDFDIPQHIIKDAIIINNS